MARKTDFSGDVYGEWTVLGRAAAVGGKHHWNCANRTTGEMRTVAQVDLPKLGKKVRSSGEIVASVLEANAAHAEASNPFSLTFEAPDFDEDEPETIFDDDAPEFDEDQSEPVESPNPWEPANPSPNKALLDAMELLSEFRTTVEAWSSSMMTVLDAALKAALKGSE